jgi:hypothetical protein
MQLWDCQQNNNNQIWTGNVPGLTAVTVQVRVCCLV